MRLDPDDLPYPAQIRDWLHKQRRSVGPRDTDRLHAKGIQPARQGLVHAAGEHDLGDFEGLLVRHPQPSVKPRGDPERVEHPGELEAAAVDDGDPVTCRKEAGQVLERPAGQSAAPDFYDHGLHVRYLPLILTY